MRFQKEWLVNPFQRIAGVEALLAGFASMAIAALLAWPARTHFDGVIDVHAGGAEAMPAWIYFIEPLLAWAFAVVFLYAVALVGAGSRFRFLDLAGTLALSRAPMILAAPLGFAIPDDIDPLHPGPITLLTAIPSLAASIWMIVLMYHAFRVSVNPKPRRAIPLFAIGLLVAELLSKIAFSALYSTISS